MKNSPLSYVDRMGLEWKVIINNYMIIGEILWWHIRWRNAIKRNLKYINSFGNNAEYIKAIIYEEQSHLTPDEVILDWINYDFSFYGRSRWLWQINYKPNWTDIGYFNYPNVPISSVIDEVSNIKLMNDRINIIKWKLEENWKEISMRNIWSAWNW